MADLNDTRPVSVQIPVLGDLDSRERNALARLLVRLVGSAKASELTPEERRLAALVYTGE